MHMTQRLVGWSVALACLLPAVALGQGRALGPDPAEVWEGNIGYAATGASLLRCGPTEACPGTGHNCDPLPSATATLDVVPETPTLRLVHAQLNWVGSLGPNGRPDEQVTLVPPGGQPIAVRWDEARSERFPDQLDAQSCQLIGLLCPTAEGQCGVQFFSHHADVTGALQAHRDGGGTLNGQWTLRDVEIPGANDADPETAIAAVASIAIGGWSLYVVYEDAENQPLRRIYYYQGLELNEGQSRTVRPRGFLAPAEPTVDLAYFVLEGDQGIQGDSLTVNGREVGDACNPQRNVFNSTVNTGRADGMCQRQTDGIDLDRFTVEGAIRPGDEEAEVTFVLPRGDGLLTAGEQLFTDWLILAFDHRLPDFESLKPEKSSTPASGSEVAPGQRVDYAIVVENDGGDFARNVIVTDGVPRGTTYVRNSTSIDRQVIADGPGGSLPLANGLNLAELPDIDAVAPGERHIIRFSVTVDDLADGTEIRNVASIDADEIDPVETDPVVHTVRREGDGGIVLPPVDAGPEPDMAVTPDHDATVAPPDPDAAPPGPDTGCPPGQRMADRAPVCVPIECPDGSVLDGDECVEPAGNPCGPGTRLSAEGTCESICGEGLRWDHTCPGGGQCRHVDDAPCDGGGGGASDDGCGCRYADGAPGALLFLPGLLALGRWRRR
jgi:uncharacterized repeat protein (TIGR01451 family)/MYXO-CTERM domain-containing protein